MGKDLKVVVQAFADSCLGGWQLQTPALITAAAQSFPQSSATIQTASPRVHQYSPGGPRCEAQLCSVTPRGCGRCANISALLERVAGGADASAVVLGCRLPRPAAWARPPLPCRDVR